MVSEKSTNVPFMLRVYCDTCGHSMLFDSERFFRGNVPTLESEGPSES